MRVGSVPRPGTLSKPCSCAQARTSFASGLESFGALALLALAARVGFALPDAASGAVASAVTARGRRVLALFEAAFFAVGLSTAAFFAAAFLTAAFFAGAGCIFSVASAASVFVDFAAERERTRWVGAVA